MTPDWSLVEFHRKMFMCRNCRVYPAMECLLQLEIPGCSRTRKELTLGWSGRGHLICLNLFFFFFKDFIYLFLEKGEGREKEMERNINPLTLTRPQQGTWPATQALSWLGIDWQTFGSQASTQSTQPHLPGPKFLFLGQYFLIGKISTECICSNRFSLYTKHQ